MEIDDKNILAKTVGLKYDKKKEELYPPIRGANYNHQGLSYPKEVYHQKYGLFVLQFQNRYCRLNKNVPFLICGVKQGLRLKTKRHWDREESIEGATS
jgi:hypothetical protein